VSKSNIIIGIPTFKRPVSLERLLYSIASQEMPDNVDVSVVVADNEGNDGAGLKVVGLTESKFRSLKIEAFPVLDRGLTHVRNFILNLAFKQRKCDALIMVDDDEYVGDSWLLNLVNCWRQSGSVIVGGRVIADFVEQRPEWTKGQSLYWDRKKSSGRVNLIHGSGNCLISKDMFRLGDFLFDHRFSLSGGEDKDFFTRIKLAGGDFFYCNEAIVYEVIDSSRSTKSWAYKRAFRIGATDQVIDNLHNDARWSRATSFFKTLPAIAMYSLLNLIFLPSDTKRTHFCLKLFRQLGKLAGVFNLMPDVYKITTGK